MRRCLGMVAIGFCLLTTGCATQPRQVNVDSNGGCIAIPNRSDSWPTYNYSQAIETIKRQCPNGYELVKEEEVVVGQTTTKSTQRDTKQVPLAKGLAMDIQETARNTTDVSDRTEWRITYSRK